MKEFELIKELIEELKIMKQLFSSDTYENNVYLRVGVNTTLDLIEDKVEKFPKNKKEELLKLLENE